MSYRIAIVDDRPQTLVSLTEQLRATGRVEIVFTAANGKAFLDALAQCVADRLPEVVLMDVDMPVLNGIEALRTAAARFPGICFIMLTVLDDDDKLFEAIQAGAGGYLLKEENTETILAAIRDVLERNGAPMSPRIARKALALLKNVPESGAPAVASVLSSREAAVLQELIAGLGYKQIAEKLFISPNTVRKHIANIYEKLQVTSRAQVVRLAVRNKWA